MIGFRECVYDEYFLTMLSLARRVLKAFALALCLPEDHFESMFHKPIIGMRLLYYPPQPAVDDEDQLGCGAHTDFDCFTLLSQSDNSGLQVLNMGGKWIDVPPIPTTFVVNTWCVQKVPGLILFQN